MWIYDILLTYVFIHYWNKCVITMHDIDNTEINITYKKIDFSMIYVLHVLYQQLHMEVNCVLLSTYNFISHLGKE